MIRPTLLSLLSLYFKMSSRNCSTSFVHCPCSARVLAAYTGRRWRRERVTVCTDRDRDEHRGCTLLGIGVLQVAQWYLMYGQKGE